MELRTGNVIRIWHECVKCRIGEDISVNVSFKEKEDDIRDMLSQVDTDNGYAPLCMCNRRKDGEVWTPYLQIVEMLIRMGAKMGYVRYDGNLETTKMIYIKL